jgi:uncharacterized protein (DUF697 family)/tellurite resistance protein
VVFQASHNVFFALKGVEHSMLEQTQKSILAIGLFAAFADGAKSTEEREQIRRMAESLADGADQADLARLYQDVLLKRVSLASVCANLDDSGERQLAYEMAVCVCDADGRQSAAEVKFLAELKPLLRLDAAQADAFDKEADAVAELAETAVPVAVVASVPVAVPAAVPAVAASQVPQAELDKSILNHAMLCGALELLPQSWASMAIIPMQIKMVYGIGKAHGVELDQGHIKEFIAAAGVGLGSQYLEQFGRKLLGGLLGKVAGRTIGGIGRAATGVAFSFATTYALGQLAARYYAGGRVMNTALLQKTFSELLSPAKQMQAQYLPQIQAQAANLDAGKIMGMLRKGAV